MDWDYVQEFTELVDRMVDLDCRAAFAQSEGLLKDSEPLRRLLELEMEILLAELDAFELKLSGGLFQ